MAKSVIRPRHSHDLYTLKHTHIIPLMIRNCSHRAAKTHSSYARMHERSHARAHACTYTRNGSVNLFEPGFESYASPNLVQVRPLYIAEGVPDYRQRRCMCRNSVRSLNTACLDKSAVNRCLFFFCSLPNGR